MYSYTALLLNIIYSEYEYMYIFGSNNYHRAPHSVDQFNQLNQLIISYWFIIAFEFYVSKLLFKYIQKIVFEKYLKLFFITSITYINA